MIRQALVATVTLIVFCSCQQKNDTITEPEPSQYTGLYSFGGDIEKGRIGSVIVYPETDSTLLFFLDVNRGAPSYNMGQLYGRILVKDNKSVFNEKMLHHENSCKLTFEFKEEILTINYASEHDQECGFGGGVWVNGDYRRLNNLQQEFFLSQSGDTVYFTKASPEEYNEE